MDNYGIVIAEPGKSVSEGELEYDSRNGHLLVSLRKDPEHMKILDDFTVSSLSAGTGATVESEVYSIEHKLPYTPFCLTYFYVKNNLTDPGNPDAPYVGFYHGDAFIIPMGPAENHLIMRVTPTQFKIIHRVVDFGFGAGSTSEMQDLVFRIKYYIFSKDAKVDTYDGQFTGY